MPDKRDIFGAYRMFPKKRKDNNDRRREMELAAALIRSDLQNNP